ncbi:MAG: SCP2 sterol-binding domain-containing protein [Candidatus Methanofastidiosia archaeon]
MDKEEYADSLVERFKDRLNSMADSNKGWKKTLQLCLEDVGKAYIIKIGEDGTVYDTSKKPLLEKESSADVSVYTTVDVIDGIMKKEINSMMAMMQGKIRIEGDMSALMKLASAFT